MVRRLWSLVSLVLLAAAKGRMLTLMTSTASAAQAASILPIDTPARFQAAVRQIAHLLARGGVAAIPTETVYGLAANALNPKAVARIFQIKGRPSRNPIIVHVGSLGMARRWASHWPESADQLAATFWPGPLTLVVLKSDLIPSVVTAGGPSVGLRWPRHPFVQALISAADFPLAAPSANRSTALSPTTAEHVAEQLGSRIPLIVDAGPASVGIESTVVDLTQSPPKILRPGMIDRRALESALGGPLAGAPAPDVAAGELRSPGLLQKHYAPRAPLFLRAWRDDPEFAHEIARLPSPPGRIHVVAHERIPARRAIADVHVIPNDPEAFARALYSVLHECDRAGAGAIVVETPPDTVEWQGIRDRLQRAAVRAESASDEKL